MRIFHDLNVDFMGKRKMFYAISGVILLVGFINLFIRGLVFGIDFKGGTEVVMQFEKNIGISEVREEAEKLGLGNVELKTFGANGVLLRTDLQEIPSKIFPQLESKVEGTLKQKYPNLKYTVKERTRNSLTYVFPNADSANYAISELVSEDFQAGKVSEDNLNKEVIVRFTVSDVVKQNLKSKFANNSFEITKEDKVGPKVGDELKTKTLLAVVLSLLGILIYLSLRFKWIFAVGAVVALFHDVLLTLGVYAMFHDVIPGLNLEISITVVSAFLTLIGYSVNDTVIVFDRVREYMKIYKTVDIEKNVNDAVNKTMSRTILTSGTILITIIVLLVFGGEVLRSFAFTLLVGTITGTYSSIFVASAMVVDYAHYTHKKLEF